MSRNLIRSSIASLAMIGLMTVAGCSKADPAASATDSDAVQANVASAQPEVDPQSTLGIATPESKLGGPQTLASGNPTSTSVVDVKPGTIRGSRGPVNSNPRTGNRSAAAVLTSAPSAVNLGQFATNETKSEVLTLTNISSDPITIERAKTSCGCTTAGLEPGTVLGPGESVEVSISLRGGSRAQTLSKTVSFLIAGMDPFVVPVRGQAVEYVVMEPRELNRETNPEGTVTLRSIDSEPFRITGMSPPLLSSNQMPADASSLQEIKFPWDKFDEYGLTRRVTFHLDHPRAQTVFATVKVDNTQVLSPNATGTSPRNTASNRAPKTGMALVSQMFQQNQTDSVLQRLDEGLSLESRDNSGMTVLALGCRYADGAFVENLIERGADIEAPDNTGRTPLMTASQFGNLEAVQTLIDVGARVNSRDRIGNTPLSWGAGFGTAECVTELIENGADIEAVSNVTGWTPLIWASGFGDPASVQVLVEAGADLEVGDIMQGATPLINSARTGKIQSMQILITAGADLENKDRNGKSALLAACENAGGTADKVKLLIDAGADLKSKDNRGKTAYDLARARTDPRAAAVVELLRPHYETQGTQTPN